MLERFIIFLENNQKACFFHDNGVGSCPGCGIQTAIIALLKGNICESIIAYPALIPFVFTLIWITLYFLVFKMKKGEKILISLFGLDVFLIFGNWILKML